MEWILDDLYEPKRILGLLFGYLTSLAEDNRAKVDGVKPALHYAKELAEKKRRITDIMVNRCGTGTI